MHSPKSNTVAVMKNVLEEAMHDPDPDGDEPSIYHLIE